MKSLSNLMRMLFLSMLFSCKKLDDSANWNENPYDEKFQHRDIASFNEEWITVDIGPELMKVGYFNYTFDMTDFEGRISENLVHHLILSFVNIYGETVTNHWEMTPNGLTFNSYNISIGFATENQDVTWNYQLKDGDVILYEETLPMHIPSF